MRDVSSTVRSREEGLNECTRTSLALPVGTLIRVEAMARELHLSRQEALQEAVRDWTVRREGSLNRRNRLAVEEALKASMDREPIGPLLARFRDQMEATATFRPGGLQSSTASGSVASMATTTSGQLRQRREDLKISRVELAVLADCSVSQLANIEQGAVPRFSDVLARAQVALAKAESKAAA